MIKQIFFKFIIYFFFKTKQWRIVYKKYLIYSYNKIYLKKIQTTYYFDVYKMVNYIYLLCNALIKCRHTSKININK